MANKKVVRIFDTVDREFGIWIYFPPFIIWFIFKYLAVGFFGTETIMHLWKKEDELKRIFQFPAFVLGLLVAMISDFFRLVFLFLAEAVLIFYIPLLELRFSYRNKLDVKISKEQCTEQDKEQLT